MKLEHKIVLTIMVFLFIVLFAVLGYMVLLDLNIVDALYMTVITISTVGYTEVAEMTQAAKIFSIFVIIISVGILGFLASRVVSLFSGGYVNEVWRVRKMEKAVSELKDHIIICGAGETGDYVINQFLKQGIDFVVIEQDEDVIEELHDLRVNYVRGDATHDDVLMKAGVDRAKGLIAALSKDADNVFVVLTAKQVNERIQIVSRAIDKASHRKLKRAGANYTVSPNELGGRKMATTMLKPSLSYFMDHVIETDDIALDLEEITIQQGSGLVNTSLKNCKIPEKTGLIVLAIRKHSGDSFQFNPKTDTILEVKDKLIVIGEYEQIKKLKDLAKEII